MDPTTCMDPIIERERQENFKKRRPKWIDLEYPLSFETSGNSVAGKTVIGVYVTADETVNGYIAHVDTKKIDCCSE